MIINNFFSNIVIDNFFSIYQVVILNLIKKYFILFLSALLLFSCISIDPVEYTWEDLQNRFDIYDNTENFQNWDIAHYVAAIGSKEEMLMVIDRGVSIESMDFNGNTPVMVAQRYNNLDTFEVILNYGYHLKWTGYFSDDNYNEALNIAAANGYIITRRNIPGIKKLPSGDYHKLLPPDMDYIYFENSEQYPFEPYNENFSLINCWWLSECSFLAYTAPGYARMAYMIAGYNNFKFFSVNDNECMVAWNDESIIISFRGTEQKSRSSFSDMVTDIRILPTSFDYGGNVHRGFLYAFNDIWNGEEGLELFLDNLENESDKRAIWITGHSLGGALAGLCFSRLRNATGLYTFGAPRIGDKKFLELTKGKHMWRVENSNDPIPRVPLSISHIFMNYGNLGDLIYIGAYGDIINLCDTIYTKLNINYTQSYIAKVDNVLLYHMPIYYCCAIWNNIIDRANLKNNMISIRS